MSKPMKIKQAKNIEKKYLSGENLSNKDLENLYIFYRELYKSADAVVLILNESLMKYKELSKVDDELISKQEQVIKLQRTYINMIEESIKVKSDVHTT